VRILRDHQYFFARSRNCATRDVFSHNLKPQSGHENFGRDFNSGAAHHFRGGLHRSGFDRRSAEYAKHELIGLAGAFWSGGRSDAFGGSISQIDKRTRGGRCVPDRIANLGRADVAKLTDGNGQQVSGEPDLL
jgi:hypothetical protein